MAKLATTRNILPTLTKKKFMGLDPGNGFTKGVKKNGKKFVSIEFPSNSTDGSMIDLASLFSATGRNEYTSPYQLLRDDEYVIKIDPRPERFIGNLAIRQNPQASTGRGSTQRYHNFRIIELVLTAAVKLFSEPEFELVVVTGVPAQSFSPEFIKGVVANLQGDYRFLFNGVERHIVISHVKVIQEGAGASIVLTEPGETYAVVDIGHYSTEVFSCDETGRAKIKNCAGTNLGVGDILTAMDRMYREYTKSNSGLSPDIHQQAMRAYRAPLAVKYPRTRYKGLEVSSDLIKKWLEDAIDQIGDRLVEFLATVLKDDERGDMATNFDHIIIVGGGAYLLAQKIRQEIPHLVMTDDSVMENAKGYCLLAEEIARRLYAANEVEEGELSA